MVSNFEKEQAKGILGKIRESLEALGLEFTMINNLGDLDNVKVVGIGAGVKEAVDEMSKSPRDNVVMVRVDEGTTKRLDAWVEAGIVKSRSEAAALFIREGLSVRASELEQMEEALKDLREAKERLKQRARQVFGADESTEGQGGKGGGQAP